MAYSRKHSEPHRGPAKNMHSRYSTMIFNSEINRKLEVIKRLEQYLDYVIANKQWKYLPKLEEIFNELDQWKVKPRAKLCTFKVVSRECHRLNEDYIKWISQKNLKRWKSLRTKE